MLSVGRCLNIPLVIILYLSDVYGEQAHKMPFQDMQPIWVLHKPLGYVKRQDLGRVAQPPVVFGMGRRFNIPLGKALHLSNPHGAQGYRVPSQGTQTSAGMHKLSGYVKARILAKNQLFREFLVCYLWVGALTYPWL